MDADLAGTRGLLTRRDAQIDKAEAGLARVRERPAGHRHRSGSSSGFDQLEGLDPSIDVERVADLQRQRMLARTATVGSVDQERFAGPAVGRPAVRARRPGGAGDGPGPPVRHPGRTARPAQRLAGARAAGQSAEAGRRVDAGPAERRRSTAPTCPPRPRRLLAGGPHHGRDRPGLRGVLVGAGRHRPDREPPRHLPGQRAGRSTDVVAPPDLRARRSTAPTRSPWCPTATAAAWTAPPPDRPGRGADAVPARHLEDGRPGRDRRRTGRPAEPLRRRRSAPASTCAVPGRA